MKNIAIIVGAGSGERFGSYKQVETINNKPVYKYSIDAFLDSECFSQIILAVPKKLLSVILNQLNEDRYKDIIVCEGGNTRAQSVYNAFSKIKGNNKNLKSIDVLNICSNKPLKLQKIIHLMGKRNIKPTKLLPLWDLMGVTLGFGTAMLGEKAAMLCTASVEEVIDGHYKDQTYKLGKDEEELKKKIMKFRQDELDHKDIAYDNGATKKGLYGVLDKIIKTSSRIAITISEKV